MPQYNASYKCSELVPGWVGPACPNGDGNAMQTLDKSWTRANFQKFAVPLQDALDAPVFINQWEAVHGITAAQGRFEYIRDIASLAEEFNFGWAWWTWAGGNDAGWSHGSSEVVFRFGNGTAVVDTDVLAAMKPYMG